MPAKTKKSAPVKLDETQLDAAVGAVGGATFQDALIFTNDPGVKGVRTIVPCVKIVRTL